MRIHLKQTVKFTVIFVFGLCLKIMYIDTNRSVSSGVLSNVKLSIGNYFGLQDKEGTLSKSVFTKPRNLSVDEIKILAAELNSDQVIRNIDKFGLKLDNNSVVILIQVHKRVDTLSILLESLRHVKYINQTLVIFSHDVYDVDIFKIVQSIDFCPVMQLFYPFAIQTHEKVFPGTHPNDCPRNLDFTSAVKRGCNNAEFPDQYKHYREAHICQIRHHWLWKIHFVFDKLRILEDFTGTILRLEDDYYVSSDVIHFIRKLNQHRSAFPDTKMYIMGKHEGFYAQAFRTSPHGVLEGVYYVGVGAGMAFTREFWDVLKNCSQYFCIDDDYNWDFALDHTSAFCIPGGLKIVKVVANRVFHIGTCIGVHRHRRHCKVEVLKNRIQNVLKTYSAKLFPHAIKVLPPPKIKKKKVHHNGGWGDIRDHLLCLTMFNNVSDDDDVLSEIHSAITDTETETS